MNVGRPHRFRRPVAPNGILFGWDPRRQEHVHYYRKSGFEPADVDGRTVRTKLAVMRTAGSDFETWGDTREVLERGPDDPPRWSPSHGVDLAGALYTDDLYVGFVDTGTTPYVDDVADELWENVHSKEFAEYRTELLVSRDGVRWDRIAPNWEFMRPGLWGTWDRDHVGLAKPIVRNDQVLIYYLGSNIPMGSNAPRHPQYTVHNTVVDGQYMGHSIGLATMRLDGFASIEAYDDGGTLTTKPMVFDGDRLVINARAPEEASGTGPVRQSPFGTLTVEVLDAEAGPIAGYAEADCVTFSGDQVRRVVTWNGDSGLGRLAGAPVRLRFHMRNAALYSFQFRGEALDEGPMNLFAPGSRGRP